MKCFYQCAAAMLAFMLVVGSGALAPPAAAQSSWERSSDDRDTPAQYEQPNMPDPAGSGVPEWARDSDQPFGGFQDETDGSIGAFDTDMNSFTPDPPDDPSRIPVDGGLTLLALAGAGYAARRLRSREEEPRPDELQ